MDTEYPRFGPAGGSNLLERSGRCVPEVVEAELHRVSGEMGIVAEDVVETVVAAIVVIIAEVEVEVFRLDRPARADLPLEASAHGPAGDKIVIVVVAVENARAPFEKKIVSLILLPTRGKRSRPWHRSAPVPRHSRAGLSRHRRSRHCRPVQRQAPNRSTHGPHNEAIIVLVEGNSAEVDFDAVNEIRTEEIPTLQVISELAAAKAVCGVEVSLPEREVIAEQARHVTSGEHMVVQVQLRPSDPHMAAYIEPGPQRWRDIGWHVLQAAASVHAQRLSAAPAHAKEVRP